MGWARVHTCRVTGGGTDRWVGLESVLVGSLEADGGTGGWVGLESILAGSLEGVQTGG